MKEILTDDYVLGTHLEALTRAIAVKFNQIEYNLSELNIASDEDIDTLILETLGSYSTTQLASHIIMTSSTENSEKQFELSIDDNGILSSQEL